jgi:cytoskeletal protein RodZ
MTVKRANQDDKLPSPGQSDAGGTARDLSADGPSTPRRYARGNLHLRVLLAGLLGVSAALLVACGSSGKGLIPTANAGPLQSDFEAVAQAAESGEGNCTATEAAIQKTESDFAALPATVDAGLRKTLDAGIANLRHRALALCAQQFPQTTSTSTTKTSTTPTTTTNTQTTPTATTPAHTETSTTPTTPTVTTPTATTPGGGTPAPGSESEPGVSNGPGGGTGIGGESGAGAPGAGAGGAQESAK